MLPQQREVILVLGQTGSGKTTWARQFVKKLNRVIIADLRGMQQYNTLEAEDFEDFKIKLTERYSDGHGFFRLAYTPLSSEYSELFRAAAEMNYSHTQNAFVNQSWLVLEEADILPGPEMLWEYDEAVSRGRHYGINLLAISLYPAKLPTMLRRQATRIIAFRTIMPSDVDWFKEVIGDEAEHLNALPRFHYLDWHMGEIQKLCLPPLEKMPL